MTNLYDDLPRVLSRDLSRVLPRVISRDLPRVISRVLSRVISRVFLFYKCISVHLVFTHPLSNAHIPILLSILL